MKMIYKARGAVSIFLIIILLPSLTIAGVFIDMARTKLAHEVIVSSADLALNTVLTDYDQSLKDYFGLLASSQDTDAVIETSKRYFVESMVSAGVSTSDAQEIVDEVVGAFLGDSDIQDMLMISVEPGATEIERVPNGALDNPALIKNGIIEFMKYRAPVNAAADLFSKLTDPEVEKEMENASKETQMIEARNAFYTAERELIEQAEKAYDAIKEYQNYKTKTGDVISSESYLDAMSEFVHNPDINYNGELSEYLKESDGQEGWGFEELFSAAHTTFVMNLYNTHDAEGNNKITLLRKQNFTTQYPVTTYSDSAKASATKISKALNEMNTAYVTYCQKRAALDTAWSNVSSKKSSDWPIQYWVFLTKECKEAYTEYVNAANNLWKKANIVDNAVSFPTDGAMDEMMTCPNNGYVTYATPDELGQVSIQNVYNALWNSYVNNYQSEIENKTGGRSYRNINKTLEGLDTEKNNNLLDAKQLNPIFRIRNKLADYVYDTEKGAKLSDTAAKETNKLKDKIDNYRNKFQAWKSIANDPELDDSELATKRDENSPMQGGDRQQIQYLEENGLEFMSKNSVKELNERLKKIHKLWKTFNEDLASIKYKSKSVTTLSDFSRFRSAASLNEGSIVMDEGTLRQYASDSFSFTIAKEIQRIEIPKYESHSDDLKDGDVYRITDSFYPDIEHTSLDLYEWMKAKFDGEKDMSAAVSKSSTGYDVSGKGEAKSADKDIGKKSEKKENLDDSEALTGNSFSEWSGAALPSGGAYVDSIPDNWEKLSEVSSYMTSIFSDFRGTFKSSLVSARDDLYTISYIFDMFTWDTFEKEGCYNLLSDEDKKSDDPTSKYDSVKSNWMSDANKTLTLTPRDTKNNWAYGGEIEYILYGSTSNEQNKSAAYRRVFMMRYAFDLAPVFKIYWDDTALNALAHALEVFAHIPTGVTKTVACLAITAAEAGADVKILKTGQPVLLYKSQERDIICSYRSVFAGDPPSNGAKIDGRIALQYSDYLKVFLLMKMIGSNENAIYLRTGDVIQANMSLVLNDYGYSLSKAQVFYRFSSTVKIKPLWSSLLLIDDLGDLSESTGWRTTTINMTSGY